MLNRTAVVASSSGLHARPASVFTAAAARCGVPVSIARQGEEPVDATSILSVMALGVAQGDTVVLSTPQEGAGEVLDELVSLLASDLDA